MPHTLCVSQRIDSQAAVSSICYMSLLVVQAIFTKSFYTKKKNKACAQTWTLDHKSVALYRIYFKLQNAFIYCLDFACFFLFSCQAFSTFITLLFVCWLTANVFAKNNENTTFGCLIWRQRALLFALLKVTCSLWPFLKQLRNVSK